MFTFLTDSWLRLQYLFNIVGGQETIQKAQNIMKSWALCRARRDGPGWELVSPTVPNLLWIHILSSARALGRNPQPAARIPNISASPTGPNGAPGAASCLDQPLVHCQASFKICASKFVISGQFFVYESVWSKWHYIYTGPQINLILYP